MAYLPSSTRIFTSANIARVAVDGVGLHLLFHVVTRRLPFLKQEMPQRGVRAHTWHFRGESTSPWLTPCDLLPVLLLESLQVTRLTLWHYPSKTTTCVVFGPCRWPLILLLYAYIQGLSAICSCIIYTSSLHCLIAFFSALSRHFAGIIYFFLMGCKPTLYCLFTRSARYTQVVRHCKNASILKLHCTSIIWHYEMSNDSCCMSHYVVSESFKHFLPN